jgi:hypothetical protein
MAGNSAIELLPAELIVLVATSVPCFSDVRALAATSTRFREVCVANSSTIDRHVAPRSIPCEPHARGFLELSARCKGDRTWSHILQISRNAAILDKSLCLFEWQMVSNYKPRGMYLLHAFDLLLRFRIPATLFCGRRHSHAHRAFSIHSHLLSPMGPLTTRRVRLAYKTDSLV